MPPLKTLGKYELIKELGRGGFATVYQARDTQMEREVALKVISGNLAQEAAFVERFRQEAASAARLHHPNIVTVFDFGDTGQALYLAMRLIQGPTLAHLLEERGRLPLAEALPILEQLAQALDYLHGQALVHRDLKPANVMLEGEAAHYQVTLTDFGLVRSLEASTYLTETGSRLGTPAYMAPEQADSEKWGDITTLTDVYALGVLVYEMLVGRPPFIGKSLMALLRAHADKLPPSPLELAPDVGDDLDKVLLQGLAKPPTERYPTATAFVADLAQAHRVQQLYQQLQAAHQRGRWSKALVLGGRIETIRPNYRDVPAMLAQARHQTQVRPTAAAPRAGGLPHWWWGAGAGLLVLACLMGLGISSLAGWLAGEATLITPTGPIPTSSLEPGSTRLRETDGMTMVYVPAGRFPMGSVDDDPNADGDEKPQHTVTLEAFWLDQTEVTNAQYNRCVEAGVCQPSPYADNPTYNGADYPVVGVSWYEAVNYCEWIGGWLPTEAEWEYAARGAAAPIYPWGNEPPTCELAQFGDCDDNIIPVGSLPAGASWVGALDMAGNVWEWVEGWYQGYPGTTSQDDDFGETYKVLRGGSWLSAADYARASNRNGFDPNGQGGSFGFRCVVVAPGP